MAGRPFPLLTYTVRRMIAYIVLFGSFALGAMGVWCTQCSEKRSPEAAPIVSTPSGSYNNRGPDHL